MINQRIQLTLHRMLLTKIHYQQKCYVCITLKDTDIGCLKQWGILSFATDSGDFPANYLFLINCQYSLLFLPVFCITHCLGKQFLSQLFHNEHTLVISSFHFFLPLWLESLYISIYIPTGCFRVQHLLVF